MTTETNGFSQKETANVLNNAVQTVLRPGWLAKYPDLKLQCLREYTQAMLAVPLEHVEASYLLAEELVAILVTAALYVHAKHVLGGKLKIPAAVEAKELMES